jgi:hypothetical protein
MTTCISKYYPGSEFSKYPGNTSNNPNPTPFFLYASHFLRSYNILVGTRDLWPAGKKGGKKKKKKKKPWY